MNRDYKPIQPQAGLEIQELMVKVRDGAEIRMRTYRQSSKLEDRLPLFFYMHGGGYVIGGLETDDASCRAIAAGIDIMVVNVEYRLAPENKFPVGFQDCHDLARWVCSHVMAVHHGQASAIGH